MYYDVVYLPTYAPSSTNFAFMALWKKIEFKIRAVYCQSKIYVYQQFPTVCIVQNVLSEESLKRGISMLGKSKIKLYFFIQGAPSLEDYTHDQQWWSLFVIFGS